MRNIRERLLGRPGGRAPRAVEAVLRKQKPGTSSEEAVLALDRVLLLAVRDNLLAAGWRNDFKRERGELDSILVKLAAFAPADAARIRREHFLFEPNFERTLGLSKTSGARDAWASEKSGEPDSAHELLKPFFARPARCELIRCIREVLLIESPAGARRLRRLRRLR